MTADEARNYGMFKHADELDRLARDRAGQQTHQINIYAKPTNQAEGNPAQRCRFANSRKNKTRQAGPV
jgi:hypothetical protein